MIHNRDTREITRDPPFALVRTHSLLEMFFVRVTLRRFPIFRSRKHVVFVWLKRRLSSCVSHRDVFHTDGGIVAVSVARHRRRVGEEIVPTFSARTIK